MLRVKQVNEGRDVYINPDQIEYFRGGTWRPDVHKTEVIDVTLVTFASGFSMKVQTDVDTFINMLAAHKTSKVYTTIQE